MSKKKLIIGITVATGAALSALFYIRKRKIEAEESSPIDPEMNNNAELDDSGYLDDPYGTSSGGDESDELTEAELDELDGVLVDLQDEEFEEDEIPGEVPPDIPGEVPPEIPYEGPPLVEDDPTLTDDTPPSATSGYNIIREAAAHTTLSRELASARAEVQKAINEDRSLSNRERLQQSRAVYREEQKILTSAVRSQISRRNKTVAKLTAEAKARKKITLSNLTKTQKAAIARAREQISKKPASSKTKLKKVLTKARTASKKEQEAASQSASYRAKTGGYV